MHDQYQPKGEDCTRLRRLIIHYGLKVVCEGFRDSKSVGVKILSSGGGLEDEKCLSGDYLATNFLSCPSQETL